MLPQVSRRGRDANTNAREASGPWLVLRSLDTPLIEDGQRLNTRTW